MTTTQATHGHIGYLDWTHLDTKEKSQGIEGPGVAVLGVLTLWRFCGCTTLPSTTLMEENKRALLFNVKEPFEMSIEEYDNLWPFVLNIWVGWGQNSLANGDS